MTRTWSDGSAPYLNATNLNGMETDITTALGVPDAALASRINNTASAARGALNAAYAGKQAPPTTGSATGIYDRRLNIYNLKPAQLRRTRAAAAKARAGTAFWQVSFVGDSITAGQGGVPGTSGWADQLPTMLGNLGYGTTGTGWASAYTNVADTRWTVGAGWASQGTQSTLMQNNTTANALTFTSTTTGTSCHVYYYQGAGAAGTFTVSIDGAAGVTVTPAGGDTIGTYSVTGLTNATHSIAVVRTGTTYVNIAGVEVRSASTGVHHQKVAIGGAGITTINSSNGFGLCSMTSNPWAADTVFLAIGTNDATGGATTSNMTNYLATSIGLLRTGNTPDIILINEPPRSDADISALTPAIYATADTYDLPVIDWMDRWGTYSAMSSLYNDVAHPTASGHGDFARAVIIALGL